MEVAWLVFLPGGKCSSSAHTAATSRGQKCLPALRAPAEGSPRTENYVGCSVSGTTVLLLGCASYLGAPLSFGRSRATGTWERGGRRRPRRPLPVPPRAAAQRGSRAATRAPSSGERRPSETQLLGAPEGNRTGHRGRPAILSDTVL